ncbi:MAG: MaoC family dehydratase [Microbacterium sp.]
MNDRLTARNAVPGRTTEIIVVSRLTRTQIAQYAGASGDFNPLHTDEAYAVEVGGFAAPVAHGMLTMGLTARAVAEWIGSDRVEAIGVRFLAPVFPGDTLTTRLEVESATALQEGVRLRLAAQTRNQDDVAVVSGYAQVVLTD